MKYIDADKLIALIDAKLEDLGMSGSVWVGRSVLIDLKNDIITSLQQEQPEVDLEKEIARFALNGGTGDNTPTIGEVARHFYELGKNTKRNGV